MAEGKKKFSDLAAALCGARGASGAGSGRASSRLAALPNEKGAQALGAALSRLSVERRRLDRSKEAQRTRDEQARALRNLREHGRIAQLRGRLLRRSGRCEVPELLDLGVVAQQAGREFALERGDGSLRARRRTVFEDRRVNIADDLRGTGLRIAQIADRADHLTRLRGALDISAGGGSGEGPDRDRLAGHVAADRLLDAIRSDLSARRALTPRMSLWDVLDMLAIQRMSLSGVAVRGPGYRQRLACVRDDMIAALRAAQPLVAA